MELPLMIVFAFHFNRGAHLNNLVLSVEKHIDAPLVIIDDGSTDADSLRVLEGLSKRYEVLVKPARGGLDRVTGGLHTNMQWALQLAAKRSAEIALMIQEDMQVVRDILPRDFDIVKKGFERPNSSFVIQTCFLKGNRGRGLDQSTMYEPTPGLYERRETEGALRAGRCFSYSDTGFFSVPLFFRQMSVLETGEEANELSLRSQGVRMGFLADPFMHFLPLPSDKSRANRRWQDKIADRLAGAGIHSIASMSEAEVMYLLERDKKELPYAEDFLRAPTMPPSKYWSLRSGRSNLRARGGWRRVISRLLPN